VVAVSVASGDATTTVGPGGVKLRGGGWVGALELGEWIAARSSSGGGEGCSGCSAGRVRMLPTATAPVLDPSLAGTALPLDGFRGLSGGGSVGADRKPGRGVVLGGMT
jgi:hypothetical protein